MVQAIRHQASKTISAMDFCQMMKDGLKLNRVSVRKAEHVNTTTTTSDTVSVWERGRAIWFFSMIM